MIIATDYPFMDILWTMLIFFFWVIWFWTLIIVLTDVFGRNDISGWAKALWVIFTIFLPLLGVLVYLIVYGNDMAQRRMEGARAQQQMVDEHIRQVAEGDAGDWRRIPDRSRQGAARQRRDRPGGVRPAQAQGTRLSAVAHRPGVSEARSDATPGQAIG